MSMIYVLLLGFAVSIDALIAGVAYGLKKINMPIHSLLVVGIVTAICTSVAIACANMLGRFIDTHMAIVSGACLLIVLGIWSIFQEYLTKDISSYEISGEVTVRKLTFNMGHLVISIVANPETADVDHSKGISPLEALFLGLALGIDNMVATFAAALIGLLPLYTPLAMAIIQMLLIAVGVYTAARYVPESLRTKFPYIPGMILILLGIIRLG